MEVPLVQITYRDMDPTPGMEAAIRDKIDHLVRYHARIQRCHVVVESPHQSAAQNPKSFRVLFDITVPGKSLAASKDPQDKPEHRDFYVALKDAYEAARKQLAVDRGKRRGDTKVHDVPPHGRVSKMFPGDDHGFVFMPDGTEVYFHKNAVIDEDWESIEVGDEVRLVVQDGTEGPQASTVKLIGKHHLPPVAQV